MDILTSLGSWALSVLSSPGASAGAIVFSGVLGSIIATIAIVANRKTTKERETINLISNFIWDKDYIAAREIFINLRDNGGLETCRADPMSDQSKAVGKIMNHYEVLSIGMRRGILSKKIYADWQKTRFVEDWVEAKSFIEAVRRKNGNNEKIYAEFERLAKKWQKDMPNGSRNSTKA